MWLHRLTAPFRGHFLYQNVNLILSKVANDEKVNKVRVYEIYPQEEYVTLFLANENEEQLFDELF